MIIIEVIDMDRDHKIGQTIKFFRQLNNMNQYTLAVGICTTSYLSRIENGLVERLETYLKKCYSIIWPFIKNTFLIQGKHPIVESCSLLTFFINSLLSIIATSTNLFIHITIPTTKNHLLN
ncbi:hypothetical protein BB14905_05183 [Bacillus sp. B14905]|nr:hypothetical protein BB14905_05183 [Bacillus sp. B14905]